MPVKGSANVHHTVRRSRRVRDLAGMALWNDRVARVDLDGGDEEAVDQTLERELVERIVLWFMVMVRHFRVECRC